jgi:hypothetical protein
MRKFIAAAFACTILAGPLPASAAVFLCDGANCVNTDENVLVDAQTGNQVLGVTNQTNATVVFSGEPLVQQASGQASIGAADGLLNDLTFSLVDGWTFETAIFNLSPFPGPADNEATRVFITYLDSLGNTGMLERELAVNGNNFTGIYGTEGELFTSISFAFPGETGIQDFRQLRLGGVSQPVVGAIPEPTTWAMMLLGFGAIGFGMRRRKKDGVRLRLQQA